MGSVPFRWLWLVLIPLLLGLRILLGPGCPFLALSGWSCPGCGGLRSLSAALGGDLGESLALNALALPLGALALYFMLLPLARRALGWEGLPLLRGKGFHWGLVLLLLAFFLLRNLSPLPLSPP